MSLSVHPSLRSGKALAFAGLVLAAYPAGLAVPVLGYQFRPVTEARHLALTPMKAQDGAEISLVYRYTTHWFFLPYAITADGHALQVKGKPEPVALDSKQFRSLQTDGLLPEPLPAVSLTWGDRLLGSLLWIVLLPLLGWSALRYWRQMQKARAVAAAKPAPHVPLERIAPKPAAQPAKVDAPGAASAQSPAPSRAPVQAPASEPVAASPRPHASARQVPSQQCPAQPVPSKASAPAKAPASPAKTAPVAQNTTAAPASKPAMPEARIKCRVKSLKAA